MHNKINLILLALLFCSKLSAQKDSCWIEILGKNPDTLEVNKGYHDSGYICHCGSHDTDSLKKYYSTVKDSLNTSQLGTWPIHYTLAYPDNSNRVTITRYVNVIDTIKPVIHLKVKDTLAMCPGEHLEMDNLISITDNYWQKSDLVITVETNLNSTDTCGIYWIRYSVVDKSGNRAISKYIYLNIENNGNCLKPCISTGIKNSGNSFLSIYPNPTTGKVWLKGNIDERSNIIITDVTGRVVYSATQANSFGYIDLSDYPNGLYFVEIQSRNYSQINKIEIRH